jgi:hypothetical protein
VGGAGGEWDAAIFFAREFHWTPDQVDDLPPSWVEEFFASEAGLSTARREADELAKARQSRHR